MSLRGNFLLRCTSHANIRSIFSRASMSVMLKRKNTEGSVSPPAVKRKITSATTSKAVANFFVPTSQKPPDKTSWSTIDGTLLACRYDKEDAFARQRPRKVAAFDLDSTLITTASGKRFGRDASDWKWWHAVVESTLQQLVTDGYLVAILSNQGGLQIEPTSKTPKQDQKKVADFKAKASAVLSRLDLPVRLYAATGPDRYRKPRTGMWEQLLRDVKLEGADMDLANSFFIGDAGGRVSDFSCSDRDMAANIGVSYHTPEEFFLKEDTKPFARAFDPLPFIETLISASNAGAAPGPVFKKRNDLELVVMVGSPGAGKSTFFWDHLKPLGYERVNQDTLKTRDRCIKAARECLEKGIPVVVDNTNADIDTRLHWIKLGQDLQVPVRCVLFTASAKLCEHNDTVRALGGEVMNPEARSILPRIAFGSFSKRYREPTVKEGFQDITKVHFEFKGTDEQRAVWTKYWLSG